MKKRDNRKNGGLRGIGCLFVLCAIGVLGFIVYSSFRDSDLSEERLAERRMETEEIVKGVIPPTIVEMEEIDWVEYNGNELYIGINKVPSDLKPMIDAWAIQANKALGRGVHIWAVRNAPKGWRPGDSTRKGYQTTARDGVIK